MIQGFLKKFEPTEKGVTVIVHCEDDQMDEIFRLWKKPVSISPQQGDLPVISIHDVLERAIGDLQRVKREMEAPIVKEDSHE